jgi:hypothetical protein
MSGKDRGKRGKNIAEVTYFVPKHATSYACYGQLGHKYTFSKTEPAKVHLICDVEAFRMRDALAECDAKGTPLQQEQDGPKPLSVLKTVPATHSPIAEESEVLTTDRKKKKKKKKSKKKKVVKKEKKKEEEEEEEDNNKEEEKEGTDEDEDEETGGILGLDTDGDEEDED